MNIEMYRNVKEKLDKWNRIVLLYYNKLKAHWEQNEL